jgi:hypothetical protein
MPPLKKEKLTITINGDKKISALYLAEALQHTQNILYQVGDYLSGNTVRQKGDFPKPIKESCTLFVTELKNGSAIATMNVYNGQNGLGINSLCITDDLMAALSKIDVSEEELHKIINDPHRVNKILREVNQMLPDEESNLNLSFSFDKSKTTTFNFKQKEKIESLLHKAPEKGEKEVFGRLFDVRVDKNKVILIDPIDSKYKIKCKYAPEIEEYVISLLGKFVNVRGEMITEPTGKFVLKIDQESSIEQKNEYMLTSVKIKNAFYKLENAVPIELDYENDYYIAYNNDLKLLSSESTLKETIDGIMDQFEDQWLEYVEVDEDTLSKSGNKLRNELLKTVGKRHVEL